jgi:hypothetical protein
VAPSLTRGRVFSLQLLLCFGSKSVVGSGPGYFAAYGQSASLSWCRAPIWGPWPDFYYPDERTLSRTTPYCLIRDSPNLEGQAPVFISPRNRWPSYAPWHWVPFLSPLTRVFYQSQSYIAIDSQSASLSWCQAPIWDPRPIFSLLSLISFRHLRVCWCVVPSLTRSRVCSFQFLPFSDLSPTGLMSIFYCLYFETPPTWRARFLYLFPPGTGWPSYTPGHSVCESVIVAGHHYKASEWTHNKTSHHKVVVFLLTVAAIA